MTKTEDKTTTIPLKMSTRNRLKNFATKSQTYDEALNILLDIVPDCYGYAGKQQLCRHQGAPEKCAANEACRKKRMATD